jgi:hypothetical protein
MGGGGSVAFVVEPVAIGTVVGAVFAISGPVVVVDAVVGGGGGGVVTTSFS